MLAGPVRGIFIPELCFWIMALCFWKMSSENCCGLRYWWPKHQPPVSTALGTFVWRVLTKDKMSRVMSTKSFNLSQPRRRRDIKNVISCWPEHYVSFWLFLVLASLKSRKTKCLTYKTTPDSESRVAFSASSPEGSLSLLLWEVTCLGLRWLHQPLVAWVNLCSFWGLMKEKFRVRTSGKTERPHLGKAKL